MTAINIAVAAKRTPLLKWAGGKRGLLSQILPLVPDTFNCYYEPFFGGGALFFALEPTRAVLSDLNSDLINCYQQIKDNPNDVIDFLSSYSNSREIYYQIRENCPLHLSARAARIIYLTTLAFNGIYRQNKFGAFNVPYSNRTHVNPCNTDKIKKVSCTLATAKLVAGDFGITLADAEEGDLVYLDPPYTVAHENNGFVKYNDKIFSWADQVRLAELAKSLNDKGCHVIVSNANHESIKNLYSGFQVEIVSRNSVIAAARENRCIITECVFHNRI